MTLVQWVKHYGALRVSKLLGVHLSTVSAWTHYRSIPRPEVMKKIIHKTDGIVSYESIIEDYLKNK